MKRKRARSGKTVTGAVLSRPPGRTTGAKPLRIPPLLLEGDDPGPRSTAGPAQKYALGRPPPTQPRGTEPPGLPEAYGTGKLSLLARDPHSLYAHWDLTREEQRHYNSRAAGGHLAVRVHRGAAAGEMEAELQVHPESQHWFIHVNRAGAAYAAELGYYQRDGQWVMIASSAPVVTPPDTVSADKAARFATVAAEAPPGQPGAPALGGRTADLSTARLDQRAERAALPKTLTPPRVAWMPAALLAAQQPIPDPSQEKSTPESLEGNWTAEQENALAEMIGSGGIRKLWMNSLEIEELIRGEVAGITSPIGGGPQAAEGFWFNINAELVIYGATEPDAKLTLGGRAIQLRPDGTFTCRFALPDGEYELTVAARSKDDETRLAELRFIRRTQYEGEVGAHPQEQMPKPG